MNEGQSRLDNIFSGSNFSAHWEELSSERSLRSVVSKYSWVADSLHGLLIVQQCDLDTSASSALVQLRLAYLRVDGIYTVNLLGDLVTPVGTFVRRQFMLPQQRRRTVLVSAAEVDSGFDLVVQFVIAGTDFDEDALEELSLLSIQKTLELLE